MVHVVQVGPLIKILFHCQKYPAFSVNGVLLGYTEKQDGKDVVIIRDAVPLFHTHLAIAGTTEVALTQISQYCKQVDHSSSLCVVGYYEAGATDATPQLTQTAKTIGTKISQHFSNSIILMLDPPILKQLISGVRNLPFKCYVQSGNTWQLVGSGGDGKDGKHVRAPVEDYNKMIFKWFEDGQHLQIADFDEHFDDIHRDWTNPNIVSRALGVST